MIEPISPDELVQEFPDFVIIGANNCIKKHFVELEGESHFTQDALIDSILAVAPEDVTRDTLIKKHWLDIEPLYRKAGWKVVYDKPGYCESYKANFTFSKPKKR